MQIQERREGREAAGTYWLLTSFSRMVEKSIGFLMTFLYPGTDFKLTGVRKGHAS